MINNKPNIFEFATKELSQDAVFCYILDCYNNPEKKRIATDFLRLIDIPDVANISKLEIKRQEDNIDIKVILEYHNGRYKYLIIEDKVFTSIHDNQLQRYKRDTINRENCTEDDIKGIYFKIGSLNITEKEDCKDAGFDILDYIDFYTFICRIDESDPILSMFSEFFAERISLYRLIDACNFNEISNDVFMDKVINSRYGQYKIMSWLMEKIFADDYNEKKQHCENNYGVPCTIYRFIFNQEDDPDYWGISEKEMPRRYGCFFRIAYNNKGWYISLRMYFDNGATENEAECALKTRQELLHLLEIDKDDVARLSGNKEKTLLLFNVNSLVDLNKCFPMLEKAARYLLSQV